MPTYGLTTTGFVPKTFEILREEIRAELRFYFGPSINLTSGVLARIVDILAERYAELWELAEAVLSSQNPDKATSTALRVLCLLTGTFALEATYSTVLLTLTGTGNAVIPVGSRASASSGAKFVTTEAGTLVNAGARLTGTGYAVGIRRTNDGRVYEVITAGATSGSGPTGTGSNITDGTVHWKYIGEGTQYVDVPAQSTEKGPIIGAAGDISTIETPVGGWQTVVNILDADPGFLEQSDESLRMTREEELAQAGTSTADAIRAALLRITDVTSVTVFVNDSDVEVDGMPPHSVEALVRGGEDAAIAQTLLTVVAAGIQTHTSSSDSAVAIDEEGVEHEMFFSRPTLKDVYVVMTLVVDPAVYPANGNTQVEQAIVDYGDAQKCGKNVVSSRISAASFAVPGVLDASCNISVAPDSTPSDPTTIAIAKRELAVYDTGRITVNVTEEEP